MMTVRELIKALDYLPPNSQVVVRNHDQDTDEMDGYIFRVDVAPPELEHARERLGEKFKLVVIQL